MLARGQGLLGGGVQVDCFTDDRRAFTLTVSLKVNWDPLITSKDQKH